MSISDLGWIALSVLPFFLIAAFYAAVDWFRARRKKRHLTAIEQYMVMRARKRGVVRQMRQIAREHGSRR